MKQVKNIMKYQLYMNEPKNYRWLLVGISEWFVWKSIIFLQSESNVATFWICMDAASFGMSRF